MGKGSEQANIIQEAVIGIIFIGPNLVIARTPPPISQFNAASMPYLAIQCNRRQLMRKAPDAGLER